MVDYEVLSIGDSSGTNPAAPAIGSATWSGTMAGFVESAASGDPAAPGDGDSFVDGDARITLPGLATRNIEQYPTWIIDGQRHTGVVSVERLGRLSSFDLDATAQDTAPEG